MSSHGRQSLLVLTGSRPPLEVPGHCHGAPAGPAQVLQCSSAPVLSGRQQCAIFSALRTVMHWPPHYPSLHFQHHRSLISHHDLLLHPISSTQPSLHSLDSTMITTPSCLDTVR